MALHTFTNRKVIFQYFRIVKKSRKIVLFEIIDGLKLGAKPS